MVATKTNGNVNTLAPLNLSIPEDGWIIDLNGIKAKEMAQLQAALKQVEETGVPDEAWTWAAKAIKAWPFEGDPSNPASYGELGLLDHGKVMRRFLDSFRASAAAAEEAQNGSAARGERSSAGALAGA